MGRECFRVPADWEHPKKRDGSYQPMHMDRSYAEEAADWMRQATLWAEGKHPDQHDKTWDVSEYGFYWEWNDNPPNPEYYRQREWTPEEATHYQMYETTSEGTPISPVMESPEKLARWLADNGASTFADQTASYDQWLRMIVGGGYAPSAVFSPETGLISGVEFVGSAEGHEG